ncbi:MAG TPA: ABC transporter ATP-binding protein [Acidobacteriota bacterium]|nr:ABC transporter ATP-binding protein [Acidobacteriota bacterium]
MSAAAVNGPALLCRQLYKRYESGDKAVDAVNGLDLEVRPGECFGLLGPNGAGKTTTVEILEGILEPTSGEVEVLGMRWGQGHDRSIRQQLGITLQDSRLHDRLTVKETIRLYRSFYEDGIEVRKALEQVGLEEKADSWVVKLSGGQQQRLAVATALVGHPKLLFLDEPTTGLDPQARRQLWEVISELKREGSTILLTTHYMDEAEKLCDRVAIIDHGEIIAQGSPHELVSRLGGEHIVIFTLLEEASPDPTRFESVDAVSQVDQEGDSYMLTTSHPHRTIPALLAALQEDGLQLASLTTRHVNLEDVFVSLTGRHLRDA